MTPHGSRIAFRAQALSVRGGFRSNLLVILP
jgi:hypothetical protein